MPSPNFPFIIYTKPQAKIPAFLFEAQTQRVKDVCLHFTLSSFFLHPYILQKQLTCDYPDSGLYADRQKQTNGTKNSGNARPWKAPKKNSRQHCLAISRQCVEIHPGKKIDSFENLAKFTADKEQRCQQLETVHLSKGQKLNRLKELSKMYAEPFTGRR